MTAYDDLMAFHARDNGPWPNRWPLGLGSGNDDAERCRAAAWRRDGRD